MSADELLMPPLEDLTFADARDLLEGRVMTVRDSLYAIGQHCSIRAKILPTEGDRFEVRLSFRAFEPELVDWSRLQLAMKCRNINRNIVGMPIAPELARNGDTNVELPLQGDIGATAVAQVQARISSIKFMRSQKGALELPTLSTAMSQTADTGSTQMAGWELIPGLTNVFRCRSEDDRVTAFAAYGDDLVSLQFEATGDCHELAVSWVLGAGGHVHLEGAAPLELTGSRWITAEVKVDLPFDRQFYFELIPARGMA